MNYQCQYHFGCGKGRIADKTAKRINEIARENGARFTATNMPGDGWCYWFSAPNLGEPFDRQTAAAVWAALERAGLARGHELTCVDRPGAARSGARRGRYPR